MRAIDAAADEPVDVLVGRAGWAVARAALDMLGGSYGRVVNLIAGPGNNGADGRGGCEHLARRGVRVRTFDADECPPALPPADLVIDGKIVPNEEIQRVASLFFVWILLLLVGGGITAALSSHGPVESLSGMFSALGNIGPCYISGKDIIALNPGIKIKYIIGMLAGRLEILPVLMLFSRRAWR